MLNNLNFEWIVAREKRRDLLRQAAQNRLFHPAQTKGKSSIKADRRQGGLKVRMIWRRAIT